MLLSKYSPWAYDAAWALAVALNKSMLYLGSNELENFSYNRSDIYDAIKRGMGEVFFQGVSVWSMFKPTYVVQIHLKSITQTGFIHSSQMTKLITNCIELKICNFIYIFHIYFKPSFIRDREKKNTNIFCRKQVAKISYRKRTHKGIEVGNPNCEKKLSFIFNFVFAH